MTAHTRQAMELAWKCGLPERTKAIEKTLEAALEAALERVEACSVCSPSDVSSVGPSCRCARIAFESGKKRGQESVRAALRPGSEWYGKPCGHSKPQAASQLHGICIFCWRNRGAAAVEALEKREVGYRGAVAAATERLATRRAKILELKQERDELRISRYEWRMRAESEERRVADLGRERDEYKDLLHECRDEVKARHASVDALEQEVADWKRRSIRDVKRQIKHRQKNAALRAVNAKLVARCKTMAAHYLKSTNCMDCEEADAMCEPCADLYHAGLAAAKADGEETG